jgi:hypothetical protein
MLTPSDVVTFKMNPLRQAVKALLNVATTRDLQKWLKKNIKELDLTRVTHWNKAKLPDLRYKQSWQILAVAILKWLQNERFNRVNKMFKNWKLSELERECRKRDVYVNIEPTKHNLRTLLIADELSKTA